MAAYIGKYVSKSVGQVGGTDRPITAPGQINRRNVSTHIRTLMHTCWRLGELPELQHLNLHHWTHTLGFRGHCLSKSRHYSTTYKALRAARTQHTTSDLPHGIETETESAWRYVRSGHSLARLNFLRGLLGGVSALLQGTGANTRDVSLRPKSVATKAGIDFC